MSGRITYGLQIQLWPWLVRTAREPRSVTSDLQHNTSNEISWTVRQEPVSIVDRIKTGDQSTSSYKTFAHRTGKARIGHHAINLIRACVFTFVHEPADLLVPHWGTRSNRSNVKGHIIQRRLHLNILCKTRCVRTAPGRNVMFWCRRDVRGHIVYNTVG